MKNSRNSLKSSKESFVQSQRDEDELFMQAALELAKKGFPFTSPNPLVGCVVVKNGKLLTKGKGHHECYGGPHAEVNAFKNLKDVQAKGSTVYVTLEPCSHFGKTAPCVDLLIEKKVARVVVAMKDPNPLVNGKGIQKLKRAGIQVTLGICEEEARRLNDFFAYPILNQKPYVALKLAQSLDGKICDGRNFSKWISSDSSRIYSHKLRSHYQAILVGIGTVLNDNPFLTSRITSGRNPIRVVLDPHLEIPEDCHLVQGAASLKTYIVTAEAQSEKIFSLKSKGVHIIQMKGPLFKIPLLLEKLYKEGISSLLVEGGAEVVTSFLNAKQVNKCHFFIAPKIIGPGKMGLKNLNISSLRNAFLLKNVEQQRLEDDILVSGDLI